MTHGANKRRSHNDAARAAKQKIGGKAGKTGPGIRATPYGRKLAGMRKQAEENEIGARAAAGTEAHTGARGSVAKPSEEEE